VPKNARRDRLDTRVVVVPDADRERGAGLARALAELDAAIVLAGDDADALAVLASELTTAGARVAVLVADIATAAGRDALAEMVNELFPPRKS
jgi:NAD(P)-dependent dehydrogenase (short-subunit alcohol dehydrogenase family)